MTSTGRARTHEAPGHVSGARYETPLETPHSADSQLTSNCRGPDRKPPDATSPRPGETDVRRRGW